MQVVNDNQVQSSEETLVQADAASLSKEATKSKPMEVSSVLDSIIKGYGLEGNEQTKRQAVISIKDYAKQLISEHEISSKYNILFLHDSSIMVKSDADHIYSSVTAFTQKKPLLLILCSKGGDVGSAYLIGKLCRECSNGMFVVSVPRHAKSAATLLCCAADEVHMGSLSELGPIDPQIDRLPALGLKNSVEHIAKLVKDTPESAEMFAKYLHYSLKPINLGYYERVAESAVQYATRLLNTHKDRLPRKPELIARSLVYTYKDHGFVIDKGEASTIFGGQIVKTDTQEYSLGNSVYKFFIRVENFLDLLDQNFYYIGSPESEPTIRAKQR